jgi:hypothetical protein
VRVFKTKPFARFARGERIRDAALREAAALWLNADAQEIERALKDGLLIEVRHDA